MLHLDNVYVFMLYSHCLKLNIFLQGNSDSRRLDCNLRRTCIHLRRGHPTIMYQVKYSFQFSMSLIWVTSSHILFVNVRKHQNYAICIIYCNTCFEQIISEMWYHFFFFSLWIPLLDLSQIFFFILFYCILNMEKLD